MSTSDVCNGCGSTLAERQKRADEHPKDNVPLEVTECPHCGSDKCCRCDMGDDVECGNCPRDEDDDD